MKQFAATVHAYYYYRCYEFAADIWRALKR